MGIKWSWTMNMMRNNIKNNIKTMVRTERFLIKHNIIKPTEEKDEDDKKDGWTVKCSLSETRFIRRYKAKYEKNAKGAGNTVCDMLKNVFLVCTTMESEDNGIIIRCKACNIRKISGFEINFWIKITDETNQIRVEYFVPFNEGIEMSLGVLKAISGSPTNIVGGGINMIASVMRVQIPQKIDDVIKSYLNT